MQILEYIDGPSYNVAPFHSNYKPIEKVGMVNGIVAIDQEDDNVYILELNNFLDFTKDMEHSLLCPMQARINKLRINDVPTNLCDVQSNENQKIVFKNNNVEIPIEFLAQFHTSQSDIQQIVT